MPKITLTVNNQSVTKDVEGRTLLVELICEGLGLTGTHIGCDTSQCGACVVHMEMPLRYSTVSITLDVYGHVLKENQRELADSYGNALELALAEQEKSG